MYKLLVIEDEGDIRENIKEYFELSGYEVYSASNGTEGIQITEKIKPDIILCDIRMPSVSGFEVKKTLSKNKFMASIPFIFLTARADIVSMREGMELGADDYIVKPIRPKMLVDAVNKRMQRISELKLNGPSAAAVTEQKQIPKERILLNTGKERIFIAINNIVLIRIKRDYSTVCTNEGKKIITRKSIKSWQSFLPEEMFIRAHRSILVNLNYIDKLEPWFNGKMIAKVRNYPESLQFSKRYSQRLKKCLKTNS